jgi:hypothetical protein
MTSNLELKHANVASQNKPLKLTTGVPITLSKIIISCPRVTSLFLVKVS